MNLGNTDNCPQLAKKTLESRKEPPACTCDTCQSMCKHPCWPTPEEAKKIIDAGLSGSMMADYWIGGQGDTWILAPAIVGYEGGRAPSWNPGDSRCIFQDKDGLCALHEKGLKPIEGRLAHCTSPHKGTHALVASTWDTREAQDMAEDWLDGE